MTNSLKGLGLLVLVVCGLHARAALADTLVLCDSISSELKGESLANGATGCVEVLSWSWGASDPVSLGVSSGKPNLSDLSMQKYVDSSSGSLFRFLVSETGLKGTLQLREYGNCAASCATPTPYLTIDMTKVRVTSQALGGAGDGRPTESVSLTYDSIKLCYRTVDDAGTLGTAQCETYTISTGVTS